MKRILLLLFFSLSMSCDKTYLSSIPNYPVYLELDLDFQDKELNVPLAYKIFNDKNVDQEIEKGQTGFGGILVYHGSSLFAFDAACPYEASRSITVSIDEDGLMAICPKCGSKYDLYEGFATPASGLSKERLKPYSVSRNGNKVSIHY